LFQVAVAVYHRDQVSMEPLAAAAGLIKTVAKQELQQLLVEVELTLLVALVQLEIPIAQQLDLYLAMVHIFKAAHHVIKLMQKVAAVVVVVTTAAAAVLIKLLVEGQKMVEEVVARATLT
jgi:hypothetical protein